MVKTGQKQTDKKTKFEIKFCTIDHKEQFVNVLRTDSEPMEEQGLKLSLFRNSIGDSGTCFVFKITKMRLEFQNLKRILGIEINLNRDDHQI